MNILSLATPPLGPPVARLLADAAAEGSPHGHVHTTDTLFFFAVVLLVGVFTVHVLERVTHIPYTALLLVWQKNNDG